MTVRHSEVLEQAERAAKAAAITAFTEEDNVERLMRRALVAGLRVIQEATPPPEALETMCRWFPAVAEMPSVAAQSLPSDGPWLEVAWEREDLVDDLDALPLPDDPEGLALLRRFGIRGAVQLEGTTTRGATFTVSRITLDRRDRWFFFWDGKAQVGLYDLTDPTPADRTHRSAELCEWAASMCDLGPLDSLSADVDERTFARISRLVEQRLPGTTVQRARLGARSS